MQRVSPSVPRPPSPTVTCGGVWGVYSRPHNDWKEGVWPLRGPDDSGDSGPSLSAAPLWVGGRCSRSLQGLPWALAQRQKGQRGATCTPYSPILWPFRGWAHHPGTQGWAQVLIFFSLSFILSLSSKRPEVIHFLCESHLSEGCLTVHCTAWAVRLSEWSWSPGNFMVMSGNADLQQSFLN